MKMLFLYGHPSTMEHRPSSCVWMKLPWIRFLNCDEVLAASRISSVIWSTGFTGDFGWIGLPGALDAAGQPLHEDGIGVDPGIYFTGLDFASTRKSGTVPGVAEEAARLVDHLAKR